MDDALILVKEEPLSYLLTLPDGVTPGRFEAAKEFVAVYAELFRKHPGVRFNFFPFDYYTGKTGEDPALKAILAVTDQPILSYKSETVEPIRISEQCKNAHKGQWICPAKLSPVEATEILHRLSVRQARQFTMLISTHRNQLAMRITSSFANGINRNLRTPVGDKYFRLAQGTNPDGVYRSQLWEYVPQSN